jgi:hypothetical protein
MVKAMQPLSLSLARKFQPLAARRGVSKVARSGRGFMAAYARAGGDLRKLPRKWQAKREAFIKRHMAQVHKRRESLFKDGVPTRRHLALVMWAYSPAPTRLKAFLAHGKAEKRGQKRPRYTHQKLIKAWRRKLDPRSVRTIRIGKHGRLLKIACPKGHWRPKRKRCTVGTKAFSMLIPRRPRAKAKPHVIRGVSFRPGRRIAANPGSLKRYRAKLHSASGNRVVVVSARSDQEALYTANTVMAKPHEFVIALHRGAKDVFPCLSAKAGIA